MIRRYLYRYLCSYVRMVTGVRGLIFDFICAAWIIWMSSSGHLFLLGTGLLVWVLHILCSVNRSSLLNKLRKFYH